MSMSPKEGPNRPPAAVPASEIPHFVAAIILFHSSWDGQEGRKMVLCSNSFTVLCFVGDGIKVSHVSAEAVSQPQLGSDSFSVLAFTCDGV